MHQRKSIGVWGFKVRVVADVKCYHCGYISGQLIGTAGNLLHPECFHPSPTYARPLPKKGDRLSCGRCGGPVYLDDVRPERDWTSRYVITPEKRFGADSPEAEEREEEDLAGQRAS